MTRWPNPASGVPEEGELAQGRSEAAYPAVRGDTPHLAEAGALQGRRDTERDNAHAERGALAERDKLRALLAQSPAIVNFLRGPELVFEFAHPATIQTLGGRDIIGKPLLEAIPEFHDQEFPQLLRRVLETGEPIRGKRKLVRLESPGAEGSRDSYWDFTYLPVRDASGRVEGVMTFDVNVTEQALAEEEQRRLRCQLEESLAAAGAARREAELANRIKDEFLTTLGHELRTPLAAILLWGNALRSGTMSDEDRDRALEAILHSARSQSRLLEDLLDLSRLAAGKLTLSPVRIDVFQAARTAIDMVQPMAAAKRQKLELEVPGRLGSALLDPARLQQVLWNLLTNAIKFTPEEGAVTLRVSRQDDALELTVVDTGEGIAPELLLKLFDRFRQQATGESSRRGGLGIGLSLSRQLVELQGGTIEAASDGPGTGSTFRVRVPWIDTPPATTSNRPMPVTPAWRPLAGVSVLLVEDDRNTREAIEWTLGCAGATVTTVTSGLEALEALEAARSTRADEPWPDVLVSDLGLPGMSGYELIERVVDRQRARGDEPLPACALSAHARDIDRQRAIEAGFDLHLAKPISAEELIEVVQDLVAVRRLGTSRSAPTPSRL